MIQQTHQINLQINRKEMLKPSTNRSLPWTRIDTGELLDIELNLATVVKANPASPSHPSTKQFSETSQRVNFFHVLHLPPQ